MDFGRYDFKDSLIAVGRQSTGLFRDHGDGIGFVQQAKLSVGMGLRGRIHEYSAAQ